MSLTNTILRAVPGAFILNSGIGKLGMDAEPAESMQGMAVRGVPPLGKLSREQFAMLLSFGEIDGGAAMLLPVVPTRLAGLALAGFSGSMVSMYLRTPGMTQSDGVRPTQEGTAIAKDTWMLAIAGALLLNQSRSKKND